MKSPLSEESAALVDLGLALEARGDLGGAAERYRRALEVELHSLDALYNLVVVQEQLATFDELSGLFEQLSGALKLHGALESCVNDLYAQGMRLIDQDRIAEAILPLRRAATLAPAMPDLQFNLGLAYEHVGNTDNARRYYKNALLQAPHFIPALNNLGRIEAAEGNIAAAREYFEQTLAGDPNNAEANLNVAMLRLLGGELGTAWDQYEFRWHGRQGNSYFKPEIPEPEWRGEPLVGKSILIYGEQGIGDEIMFASILPEITRESAQCTIGCAATLEKLFRRSFPSAKVLALPRANDAPFPEAWLESVRPFDVHIGGGSLARLRRRDEQDFPRHKGYLFADPQRIAYWRERLDGLGNGPKIGLSWRGGTAQTNRARRSIELTQLEPLLRFHCATFVDLQYGDNRDELAALHAATGLHLQHWPEALSDYDETAALVQALDLVISVCTSLIHLGGALGQTVWVMAPHLPEWRYGMEGERMRWYPSVRVFRQVEPGNWDSVIGAVTRELKGRFT